MYGVQCDCCKKFSKMEDVKNWARVQKVEYDPHYGGLSSTNAEYQHYCPDCMMQFKPSWEDN